MVYLKLHKIVPVYTIITVRLIIFEVRIMESNDGNCASLGCLHSDEYHSSEAKLEAKTNRIQWF